jgi:hypothetical protein
MSSILAISTPLRKSIKPELNKGHLAFVRRQPCCVCGSCRGVQAAHTGGRGLGTKSCSTKVIPLCWRHHNGGNDSHHALGPVRFARVHQLDVAAILADLVERGKPFSSPHSIGRKERSPGYFRYHCSCAFRTAWYEVEQAALAAIHIHLEDHSGQER